MEHSPQDSTASGAAAIVSLDSETDPARLRSFGHFAESLAVAASTADVVMAVRTHLAGSFGASFANLAIVEPGSSAVRILNPEDLDAGIVARYQTIALAASTPLTDAIRSGQPVVVANPTENARRYPELVEDTLAADLKSTASVPVLADGEVIGAIGMGWSADLVSDESMAARLASIARLTGATLSRTLTADARATFVSEVQSTMFPAIEIPAELDLVVRWKAVGDDLGFGGDWCDIISVGEQRTAVVVGDVVGHGAEAAAIMVGIRSAIKAVVQLGTSVDEVFAAVGRAINGPTSTYIGTAFIAVVDTDTATVTYTSAGHPPAMVIGPDGEHQLLDDAQGIVLGLHDTETLSAVHPFPAGSVLVAYTDGLVESRVQDLDAGIDRLASAAMDTFRRNDDAFAISEGIVRATVADGRPEDDITLVVLRNKRA